MTKIGVGVGEDFPIKDQNGEDKNAAGAAAGEAPGPAGSAPEGEYDSGYGPCGWGRGPGESYEDWRARRDAWRRQRHEWRQQRREWRHRFKADMRAFRHEMRARYRGQGYGRRFPVAPLVVAAVVLSLLLTGFFTVIFNAPVLVLGVVLLAVLYAAHRHYGPLHDYDYTPPPSGPNGAPPAQGN
ncbi:MAG: hypothetical protein KGL26_09300 [Pseudomonadota bacterium]|nr:hypothetical protein [Pseudomonadota bacterium]